MRFPRTIPKQRAAFHPVSKLRTEAAVGVILLEGFLLYGVMVSVSGFGRCPAVGRGVCVEKHDCCGVFAHYGVCFCESGFGGFRVVCSAAGDEAAGFVHEVVGGDAFGVFIVFDGEPAAPFEDGVISVLRLGIVAVCDEADACLM